MPGLHAPADVRLRRNVVVDDHGCWLWQGYKLPNGYGWFDRAYAHRAAYELLVGPIPEGLVIDHLCRNRACVNPDHLEAVTQRTNVLRGTGHSAVNANKTHCIHGHEYTPDNTVIDNGCRRCRTCRNESARRRRHAKG